MLRNALDGNAGFMHKTLLTCGDWALAEFDITTGLDGIGIPGPLETWGEPAVIEGGRDPELPGPTPGLDCFKMKKV